MKEMTIAEIVANYYLPEKRNRRRATTVEGYESSLNLYVVPEFGELTIAEVQRDHIQRWVDAFDLPGAAEKAYKCLRQVIRWAIRKWALLVVDPTVGVASAPGAKPVGIELPRKPVYRFDTLTCKELIRRTRGFWGHELEATNLIESALGLRPGEAYALEWSDIDFRTGKVSVNKTLQQFRGGTAIYPTKTRNGDREVYLAKWALDRLRAIHKEAGRPKGRIIGDLTPSQVSGRIRRFARKMGLPDISMQNLRHTWGTLSVEGGTPIETVAMFLGHSSIEIAYEHYMRQTKTIMKGAQSRFTKYLFSFA